MATNPIPDIARSAAANMANRKVVRWYIMTFSDNRKGITLGLEKEKKRREICGGKPLEYFAPTYIAAEDIDGKLVSKKKQLMLNYLFVRANENELFEIKRNQPSYNVLRRVVHADGTSYIPYVSDGVIQSLQWIARSYSGYIPISMIDPRLLIKGDRIRITKGELKGVEAHLVRRPNSAVREIMVFVDNWMCVPLLNVRPSQYKVIGLNEGTAKAKQSYGFEKAEISQKMCEALCRFHHGETTEDDKKFALDIFNQYGALEVETPALRSKLHSLLLPACLIFGEKERFDSLIALMKQAEPTIKSELQLAQQYLILYGCTDNVFDYEKAHAIIDAWAKEEAPKKSRQVLINRLADYDKCFGH